MTMAPKTVNSGAPPPPPDVWEVGEGMEVHYLVQTPWQWVMKKVQQELKQDGMTEVLTTSELPTSKQAKLAETESAELTPSTPAARRKLQRAKEKLNAPSLKIEVSDRKTGDVQFAVHGRSSAFDGMEDKDELVRTIQRCRCDNFKIQAPSILINWDVTLEECLNLVGQELPSLKGNVSEDKVAVLKEPMSSQGKGIYFVKNAEEIHKIINEHRQRALEEPEFLDNLIAAKGRIPSWVLQAEITPPMLIRDQRKFHIRTYLVVIEQPHLPELLEMFIFKRHEVCIAGAPVQEVDKDRDPLAHITNGALGSSGAERVLLHDVPELVNKNVQEKVETFVAKTFAKHLLSDITRRVGYGLGQNGRSIKRFVVAGVDLMLTEDMKIFLLETNLHPSAPPESMVSPEFAQHLTGYLHDLVDLVVGKPSPNFISARELLVQKGLMD